MTRSEDRRISGRILTYGRRLSVGTWYRIPAAPHISVPLLRRQTRSPSASRASSSRRRCSSNCLSMCGGMGGPDGKAARIEVSGSIFRWHFLNFFPLPHGHESFRPTFICPNRSRLAPQRPEANISTLYCARPFRSFRLNSCPRKRSKPPSVSQCYSCPRTHCLRARTGHTS